MQGNGQSCTDSHTRLSPSIKLLLSPLRQRWTCVSVHMLQDLAYKERFVLQRLPTLEEILKQYKTSQLFILLAKKKKIIILQAPKYICLVNVFRICPTFFFFCDRLDADVHKFPYTKFSYISRRKSTGLNPDCLSSKVKPKLILE